MKQIEPRSSLFKEINAEQASKAEMLTYMANSEVMRLVSVVHRRRWRFSGKNMANIEQHRNTTALVTGASRGIGASVALQLGENGVDVAINYRSKRHRAQEVADRILALGREALLIQADITEPQAIDLAFEQIREVWGKLDLLVLNASGGLEQDKAPDYAMQLNLTAQVNLVKGALPLMQHGSRIVFVTSHLAHFYGSVAVYESYEAVAASKRAGEDALREMIPILTDKGIRLVVVSADLVEGTITPKLLERQSRGLIEKRRQEAGTLPNIEEFADAIVRAGTSDAYSSGETIYVGSTV